MEGPTNKIHGETHHSGERREHVFMIIREYTIISPHLQTCNYGVYQTYNYYVYKEAPIYKHVIMVRTKHVIIMYIKRHPVSPLYRAV